jgi:hypothetical protein
MGGSVTKATLDNLVSGQPLLSKNVQPLLQTVRKCEPYTFSRVIYCLLRQGSFLAAVPRWGEVVVWPFAWLRADATRWAVHSVTDVDAGKRPKFEYKDPSESFQRIGIGISGNPFEGTKRAGIRNGA